MSKTAKILAFVAFCLECYKIKHGLTGDKAAEVFRCYGVDYYLYEEYEVLHSMGESQILEYIDRFLEVRKEAK